jgi:superfamily II DNA or RNA helicase
VATFSDLFARLDPDPRVRGKQFEHVCKWFLTNDPTYKNTLRKVWLWNEWTGRWGGDAGIDLVAEDHEGRLWAIQAKAYAPEHTVTKADVDKFLAESSRAVFSYRLLIATTDKLHHVARRTINDQEKQVAFVGLSDLLTSEVDWRTNPLDMRPSPPPKPAKPREHQREAIRDVVKGFTKSGRGQLIMACGTGKTLASLFIKEKLAAERTLVLVPSLSLLKQTMQMWAVSRRVPFERLPVCSDQTVGLSGEDAAVAHTSELGVPVTTDPHDIGAFLRRRSGPRVVFSTYQSSPQIAAAFAAGRVPAFDLVIADEAHRVAGIESSDFATVLDEAAIKARRRLFMTATPRYFTGRVLKAAQEADLEVASMDDTSKFGTVFHRLTFGEAIKRDLLTDYQVAVVGVDNDTYLDWAERGTLVTLDGKKVTDARTLAGQIGLAKAMRKYDLHRTISFHSRVARAREFASEMPEVIAWMPARQRPKGVLWSSYASGEMTAGQRHVRLQHLSRLDDGQRGLLSNARCLSEGVDVPTLDGVAFIDPRRSEVDIVQAVGRAIRKSADKNVGTIVIPVFIDTDTDPETALDDSAFKPVWHVIQALRAHDEELGEQLDELRRSLGKRGGRLRLPDKIHLDLPTKVGMDFADAFDVRLVEQTTATWEFWFGLLQEYADENDNARVPDDYEVQGYKLGKWVGKQRAKWESLPDERRQRLLELPGWILDVREAWWEDGFRLLNEYARQNGHANPPRGYVVEGVELESWVRRQRRTWDLLSEDRRQRLQQLPGWTLDVLADKWEAGFRRLREYIEEHGDAKVPQSYLVGGYALGKWLSVQRRTWESLSAERRQRLQKLPGWTLDARGEWWERGFGHLQRYVEEHGNARVPQTCVFDGFNLGLWVANQRGRWDTLGDERRQRLQTLPGWTLDAKAAFWEEGFHHLQRYAEENGDTKVPQKYVVGRFKLGVWINTQRVNWSKLDEERKQRLQKLPGWAANTRIAQWEHGFDHLVRYTAKNGDALVRFDCVFDGFRLGQWVTVQRSNWESLSAERRQRLEQLPGWAVAARAVRWEEGFRRLQEYVRKNGHACPPQLYADPDGFRLGSWVAGQRQSNTKGTLSADLQARLQKLPGWEWTPNDTRWEDSFRRLEKYAKNNGRACPPQKYEDTDGYRLGTWVTLQRQLEAKGTLSPDLRDRLQKLPGWEWTPKAASWEDAFRRLREYVRTNGNAFPTQSYVHHDGYKLGAWVSQQRQKNAKGLLSPERHERLSKLPGWVWTPPRGAAARRR